MKSTDKRDVLEALAPVGVTKVVAHRDGLYTIHFQKWVSKSNLLHVYYAMTQQLYDRLRVSYRVMRVPFLKGATRTMTIRIVDTSSLNGLNSFLAALSALSTCMGDLTSSVGFDDYLSSIYVFNSPIYGAEAICSVNGLYVYRKTDMNIIPAYTVCGESNSLYTSETEEFYAIRELNGNLYGVSVNDTKNLRIVPINPFTPLQKSSKEDSISYNVYMAADNVVFTSKVTINEDSYIDLSPVILNDYVYVSTQLNADTFALKWVSDFANVSDLVMMAGLQVGEATWYYLDMALDFLSNIL